jgi:hypothetical protein
MIQDGMSLLSCIIIEKYKERRIEVPFQVKISSHHTSHPLQSLHSVCKMLQHMISLLFLFLPFSLANPKPTPTLPFTVAAFQSPFPPTASNSVTGLHIYASNGFFWADRTRAIPKTGCGELRGSKCLAGNETVLWVDREGKAFLVGHFFQFPSTSHCLPQH